MSETTKKPAHEVCLDLLTAAVDELCEFDESYSLVAPTVCKILARMVIPDKHRKGVIRQLFILLSRCNKWEEGRFENSTNIRTLLENLFELLGAEDAAKSGYEKSKTE